MSARSYRAGVDPGAPSAPVARLLDCPASRHPRLLIATRLSEIEVTCAESFARLAISSRMNRDGRIWWAAGPGSGLRRLRPLAFTASQHLSYILRRTVRQTRRAAIPTIRSARCDDWVWTRHRRQTHSIHSPFPLPIFRADQQGDQAMNSISDNWWPWVLMTMVWIVICGHFARRAWQARTRQTARALDSASRAAGRRARRLQDIQDTQGGRI